MKTTYTNKGPYMQIGNMTIGPDGSNAYKFGDTTYANDGAYMEVGNMVIGPSGSIHNFGNSLYAPDGTYMKVGNMLMGPDGFCAYGVDNMDEAKNLIINRQKGK